MALIGPGVEVSVIDESFYAVSNLGMTPMIFVATSKNKTSGTGSGTAAGTTSSTVGSVYAISSQRELTATFGNPTFASDSSGNMLHGAETNEYGLFAAYSLLGVSNRVYVVRADVDLGELGGTSSRPVGTPASGTYWLDLANTKFGIKEWNKSTQTFTVKTPKLPTTTEVTSGVPKTSFGSIGDYAIVARSNTSNKLYYKTRSNTWVQVGSANSESGDGAWVTSNPTIQGTKTNVTWSQNGTFTINGSSVSLTGTTMASMATDINNANIQGVSSAVVDGVLEIYGNYTADGNADSTSDGSIVLAASTPGTPLADVGIDTGTYYVPKCHVGESYDLPLFETSSSTPRPTGSIWIQTTPVNNGADFAVKLYSDTTGAFTSQTVPVYDTHHQAIFNLDKSGGGSTLLNTDLYVQVNSSEDTEVANQGDSSVVTGKAIDYHVFKRNVGDGLTVSATSPVALGSTPFTNSEKFTIQESIPGQERLNSPVEVTLGGTGGDDFVAAVSAAGLNYVSASYDSTTDKITISHSLGGEIRLKDVTGTPVVDAKLGTSFASAYGLNEDETTTFAGTTTSGNSNVADNLYVAPSGSNPAADVLISGWEKLSYEANTIAPVQDPEDGTLWYDTNLEADILVHNGSAFVGYQNGGTDIRGFNLANTDPNGPILSATEPETQSDNTILVSGDLWIDTSDLENYPKIYRFDDSQVEGKKFVLIDTTDQTSSDGVLFADARYHTGASLDVIEDINSTIKDLLTDNYLDLDAPDPTIYPKGMLLFNTRRSGYNVKKFVKSKFSRANFASTTDYPTLPTEKDAWVTQSGNKEDGSPYMGRKAQRQVVVKSLQSSITSNTAIREEQREFNVIACPGYPETIDEMETLNSDRGFTAFVVGDTPFRLAPTTTAINAYGLNSNSAATNGEDGLTSNNSFTGVYYPSGFTSDLAGNNVVVPPSHMALRVIALNDDVAFPWFAPAGTRRGLVDNASGVGTINAITGEFETIGTSNTLKDACATARINPVTFINGVGLSVFGQKTRQEASSALDRINVARLVNFVRNQLDKIAKPFIFEPNDQLTRNELKQSVESFMLELVAQRGLYDFAVVCDETNNTAARIDRNELYVDVAIEPVKAVEFIFIPVRLKNTGEIAQL